MENGPLQKIDHFEIYPLEKFQFLKWVTSKIGWSSKLPISKWLIFEVRNCRSNRFRCHLFSNSPIFEVNHFPKWTIPEVTHFRRKALFRISRDSIGSVLFLKKCPEKSKSVWNFRINFESGLQRPWISRRDPKMQRSQENDQKSKIEFCQQGFLHLRIQPEILQRDSKIQS